MINCIGMFLIFFGWQFNGGRSVAVNTSGCGPEDRGFDSLRSPQNSIILAPVAQWIEYLASNQRVGGSNPSGRAITLLKNTLLTVLRNNDVFKKTR